MQRVFLIAATAFVAACAAKSTTAPPQFNVTGSWTGSVSDALRGSGSLTLSLTQTGDTVNGTWSTVYADTASNIGGKAIGHVVGSTFTVLLRPLNPPTCQYGPFQVTATQSSSTSLAGTYMNIQCAIADSGSISVVIQ